MKKTFSIIGLFLVILLVLIFKPVPIQTEEECLVVEGMVIRIHETGVKDVGIELKDVNKRFYINRGFEFLNRKDLAKIMGRQVTIKYPSYWTPLDPFNKTKHISKLEYDGVVVFDETAN